MGSPCCRWCNHLDKCLVLKFQGWQNLFVSSSLGVSLAGKSYFLHCSSLLVQMISQFLRGRLQVFSFLNGAIIFPRRISHYRDCWSTCRFNPFFRMWELVFILLIITLGPRSPRNETPKGRWLCWWAPAGAPLLGERLTAYLDAAEKWFLRMK